MSNHDFTPEELAERLEKEFVRPPDTFKGIPLWPYTRAMRLLFAQVCSPEDTVIYRQLAFIYLHLKRTEPEQQADVTKHLIQDVWDINIFRAKVAFYRDTLSGEDEKVAAILHHNIVERELESRVIVGKKPGEKPQKKTVTTPVTRHGKPTHSQKKSESRRKKSSGKSR